MMAKSVAMRAFAISYGVLAVMLLSIFVDAVLPSFDEMVRTEGLRVAIVLATLVLAAVLAPLAWVWPARADRASFWLAGTIPAAVFLAFLIDPLGKNVFVSMNLQELLSSLLSLLAAVVVIASGLVAYREVTTQRPAVTATFRDRRFLVITGLLSTVVLLPTALWAGRVMGRQGPTTGQPGQANVPVATLEPRRPPGEGVRMQTIAQGNLALPTGTLTMSYLDIQHTGRLTHAHDAGLIYMLEGEQQLILGGAAPQNLRAQQAAFVPPAATHEHVASGPARWLFAGARSTEIGEKDFQFSQQSVVYRSPELPPLPRGANTVTLMHFVLEPDARTRPAKTGGVMAVFALEGEVGVLAGTGDTSIRKGQGSHLLQGSTFTIVNRNQGEARFLAYFLAPEGRPPLGDP